MPTRTNKRTGEVQEMQPDGSWKTTVPPSAGAPAFSIPTRSADPTQPFKVTQARNQAAASNFAPSTAQSDAAIKAAEAANATELAKAQRDKAIAEAQLAQTQANGGGPRLTPDVRATALQGYTFAKQLQDTVDQLNTLYNKGPGATSGIEGLKDFLPSEANKNFDAAANKSRGIVGQTLGFTGGQLNTPQEAEKAVGPYIPETGNFDSTILQKIQALQDLANNGRDKSIQILGGIPDENGVVHPVQPQAPVSSAAPPVGDGLGMNGGAKTRAQIDPMLRQVAGKAGAMMVNGASDAQIIKFLQDSGVDPANTNINEGLAFRRIPDFKTWMRGHRGQSYPFGPSFYTKEVPVSDTRQLFNKAAATDLGGDLTAGLLASGNAISGGRLDNMVSDPEMARLGMNTLRAQHPLSSFGGDLAGQATLEALAGTIPGAQGLMASRLGRRGADALYGAYSGSGESDGNAGVGALEGAASGLTLGMLGRGAQRGLGRAATGIQNANLGYLNDLGIPMSVGRIARGAENDFGKTLGGIEDRLAGLPGLDAVIGDVRQQGDRALNRAAFQQLPGHSGATGAQGIREAQNLVGKAYNFLDSASIGLDPQFHSDIAAIRANVPSNLGSGVLDRLATIDNAAKSGALNGRAWQDAVRGIRADRASLRGQPFSDQAIKSLDDAEAALMDLAARNGPADTAQKLAAANQLNAQYKTLESALDNGPAQKAGELFSAGRLDDVSRANARKFGGRGASMAGNRPFYDLTTAAKEVMPNLTPDSGTAGRLAVLRGLALAGGGLGGAIGGYTGGDTKGAAEGSGLGLGGGLTLAALLSAPYSRTGQKVLQTALLGERPKAVRTLGDLLLKANPRLAGLIGQGIGRDYFFQPELPQN